MDVKAQQAKFVVIKKKSDDARLPPIRAIHPCRRIRLPNRTGHASDPHTTSAIAVEPYPGNTKLLITSATIGTVTAAREIPKRDPAASPMAANGVTLKVGCQSLPQTPIATRAIQSTICARGPNLSESPSFESIKLLDL